jgi:hypothetical protein
MILFSSFNKISCSLHQTLAKGAMIAMRRVAGVLGLSSAIVLASVCIGTMSGCDAGGGTTPRTVQDPPPLPPEETTEALIKQQAKERAKARTAPRSAPDRR